MDAQYLTPKGLAGEETSVEVLTRVDPSQCHIPVYPRPPE